MEYFRGSRDAEVEDCGPRLNMLSRGVGCTCLWAQKDLLRDFRFAYDLSTSFHVLKSVIPTAVAMKSCFQM